MDYSLLFDSGKPPVDVLHDVLLSRGFLVETENGILRLSDNAMLKMPGRFQMMWNKNTISDSEYLDLLLRESKVGTYGIGRTINFDMKQITKRQLEILFKIKPIRREAGFYSYLGKPERFFISSETKLKGFKIPACVLETYIALLVKAYSAIGVCTYSSCDGHGNGDATISFLSYPNSRWAEKVTQIATIHTMPNSKWQFTDYHLTIESKNYDALYYKGILDTARFIYANRIQLCELRRQVIKKAVKKQLVDKDYVLNLLEMGIGNFQESAIIQ